MVLIVSEESQKEIALSSSALSKALETNDPISSNENNSHPDCGFAKWNPISLARWLIPCLEGTQPGLPGVACITESQEATKGEKGHVPAAQETTCKAPTGQIF